MLHYTKLERPARVLVPYSYYFIFFVTYGRAQLARMLHNAKLERPARGKHFTLVGPFVSYK